MPRKPWFRADVCIAVPADACDDRDRRHPRDPVFTVWNSLFLRAGLKPGDRAGLHGGTSGIGVTATLLAKAIGARVITTCGSDAKCAASLVLGADVSTTAAPISWRGKATGWPRP